ncbi:hypothetical protein AB0M34_33000 [Nocardia sp. NPDC050193]
MADGEDPVLTYLVEIARAAAKYANPWWVTSNAGTPAQVVAALREVTDRAARDLPSPGDSSLRCWYRYLVRWPDGSILDSVDGIAAADTVVLELRPTAAIVFAATCT